MHPIRTSSAPGAGIGRAAVSRLSLTALFLAMLGILWIETSSGASQSTGASLPSPAAVSGQGTLRFRVLYTSERLPAEARKVLTSAHGGFAVDLRDGRGETYFALPGAGIVQISADLKSTRLLETAPEMRDTNLHNASMLYPEAGGAYLAFPANQAQKVFITTLEGRLVAVLNAPERGTDLGHPVANDYFLGNGSFIPTDTAYLRGLLYVSTGYSNLDFVLTARISTDPFRVAWHDLAFGGKGSGAGQFGTGHGINVRPGLQQLEVADRPNSEIDRFTRYGHYLGALKMPLGSWPCDVSYLGRYAIVPSLHGADRAKGAPIYILEEDRLVSTIMLKDELGLENFQHIHNAVLREHGGKLYVFAQAWNPGDFAVLEQVTN